jgi:hypothetical protein
MLEPNMTESVSLKQAALLSSRCRGAVMEKSLYLRNQALACLRIASETGDADTAELMRVAAVRYFAQAVELTKKKDIADLQTSIGEEIRSQFIPTDPTPKQVLDLLDALDLPGEPGSAVKK